MCTSYQNQKMMEGFKNDLWASSNSIMLKNCFPALYLLEKIKTAWLELPEDPSEEPGAFVSLKL